MKVRLTAGVSRSIVVEELNGSTCCYYYERVRSDKI